MGQKPGLRGRDGGQTALRARGRHDEQRDAAQPQQGCPEQPDAGNGPAGKHLTHRQRNAGVDRHGPFPQHSSEAAGPRPEAVDQKAPEQAETRPSDNALPEHEGRSEQPRHRRPDAEDGPASRRDDDGGAPQLLLRHLSLRPQASVSLCRLSSRVRQRMWSQGSRIVLPWGMMNSVSRVMLTRMVSPGMGLSMMALPA